MDIGSIARRLVAGAGHTLGDVGDRRCAWRHARQDPGRFRTSPRRSPSSIVQPLIRRHASLGHGASRHSSSAFPMFFEVGLVVAASADLQRCAQAGDQGHDQRLALRAARCSGHRRSGVAARHGAASPGPADRDRHLEDERRADHGLRLYRRDPRDRPRRSGLCAVHCAARCRCGPIRRCSISLPPPARRLIGEAQRRADQSRARSGHRYPRRADAGDPDVGQYLRRDACFPKVRSGAKITALSR